MSVTNQQLVAGLSALSQQDLVEVIAEVLENREAEVSRPEWVEARLALVEAYRFNEASGTPSDWELLLLARPAHRGALLNDGNGPTQEGGCCGLTLVSYAKRAICPICRRQASLT